MTLFLDSAQPDDARAAMAPGYDGGISTEIVAPGHDDLSESAIGELAAAMAATQQPG